MKKCPFCSEEIQDEAIVCKHCGKELDKKKVKRKQYQWTPLKTGCAGIIVLTLVLMVISGIVASFSNEDNNNQLAKKQVETKVVFDVPKLLGKSFNELKLELGEPKLFTPTDLQKSMGITYSAEWYKNGIGIGVDFNKQNESISNIFLMNDYVKYNFVDLLKMGNLSQDNVDYFVKVVNATNVNGVAGIHICKTGYKNEYCK